MKRNNKTKDNTIIYVSLGILALVLIVTLIFLGSRPNEELPSTNTSGMQEVSLKVQGARYILSPSDLKVGVPVRLVADMNSVQGCARSIIIPEFGVRKQVASLNNIIEFTPTKTGEFDIMCSMQMYTGKFKVVE